MSWEAGGREKRNITELEGTEKGQAHSLKCAGDGWHELSQSKAPRFSTNMEIGRPQTQRFHVPSSMNYRGVKYIQASMHFNHNAEVKHRPRNAFYSSVNTRDIKRKLNSCNTINSHCICKLPFVCNTYEHLFYTLK